MLLDVIHSVVVQLEAMYNKKPSVEDGQALDHLRRAERCLLAKQRRIGAAGVLTQPEEVKAVEDEEVTSDDD